MLMKVIIRPAMASPRTNLAAPSMAPKKLLSSSSARRRRASVLVDQAGREIGVDRHLLAGHGIQSEAGRDLGDAARALGDHDEVDDHQDREDDDADDEVAAHDEAAEGLDDVAGGGGALVAVGQDQPGRCQVEGKADHRRQQQHGREGVEVEGLLDEQRGQQDHHREGDRERQADVEEPARQRQDEHHQHRHHCQREDDVAVAHRDARGARPSTPPPAAGRSGRCRPCSDRLSSA